jgi:hypothetical protein
VGKANPPATVRWHRPHAPPGPLRLRGVSLCSDGEGVVPDPGRADPSAVCLWRGGDEEPATSGPRVQVLHVEADYGQIYIYDPQTQMADEAATEDDNPLQRAMDDGYESGRLSVTTAA